jgi:CheY-like chemotaxis protein
MTGTQPLAETETTVSGRRILVVDDNRDAATSLAMLLELSGNKTETAYDGLAAIDAAARFEPDVVLLDIGLPGLNGYEVARRMRLEPWGKPVKLVAVTGWGHPEDRERAIAAGFDAHLLKPVDHAAMVKLLGEFGTGAD